MEDREYPVMERVWSGGDAEPAQDIRESSWTKAASSLDETVANLQAAADRLTGLLIPIMGESPPENDVAKQEIPIRHDAMVVLHCQEVSDRVNRVAHQLERASNRLAI